MFYIPSLSKKQLGSVSLFIAAIVVIFPRVFINDCSSSSAIDNGWSWALEFFVNHKQTYRWGKDVLYTYGPLSFLSSRSTPSKYFTIQFLYDIYIVGTYVSLFTIIYRTPSSLASKTLFSIALLFAMWEISFLMEVFNILSISLILINKRHYWLSYIILLNTALSFYIKLNTFLPSILSLILLFALLANRGKYALLFILLISFLLLNLSLLQFLNVSLADYVITAADTVKYYSYSQYGFNPAYKPVLWYGIAITVPALVFPLWFAISRFGFKINIFNALLACNTALLILLLFKQGFTRLDRGHYNQFLCLLPLVLYCVYHICTPYRKYTILLILVSIVSNLFFSTVVLLKHYEGNTPIFSGPAPLKTYFSQLLASHKKEQIQSINQGNGSYDYYSNQCINQKSNSNLCWHNRPAFQSIVAVSPYLDSLNYAYYLGPNAPDTIYYDNMTVDDRNPLWDDPQCKWAIFSNYQYRYTDNLQQLVLTHRSAPLKFTESLLLDTTIAAGQLLELPRSAGVITMRAHIDYTLLGDMRTTLFQPPHIALLLNHNNLESSKPETYRFTPALFNDKSLILNYSLSDADTLNSAKEIEKIRDLLLHFNSIHPNIQSFAFQTDMPTGTRKSIRIRLYKTTINHTTSNLN
jgi:hypothetical protein